MQKNKQINDIGGIKVDAQRYPTSEEASNYVKDVLSEQLHLHLRPLCKFDEEYQKMRDKKCIGKNVPKDSIYAMYQIYQVEYCN